METDKITSAYRKNIGETQVVVDVALQKSDAPISKVLVANAVPTIEQMEMLNGEATYSGTVEFNLVYADAEGQVFCVKENELLHGKFENVVLNPLMKPIYNVEVVEVKVEDMDDMAKIFATIAIKLDVINIDEVLEVKPTNQNIELKSETDKHLIVVSSGTKTITLNEQFECKTQVQNVLMTLAEPNLKSSIAGTGYFAVDGEVFVNSLLKVQDENNDVLKNFMETLSFKEEFEDDNIQKDDVLYAFSYVRPQDVKVEVLTRTESAEEEEKPDTLSVSVVVSVKYLVLREVETEVYTDAFSMTNKTNLVLDTLTTSKKLGTEHFKTTIEGQTVQEEPRIAKVCAITNERILVANAKFENDALFVEGVANATVLYLTDDDVPVLSSVELEVPFSNKFETSNDFTGELFATAHITDIEAKVRKGKEITVLFDVCFDVDVYDTQNCVIVKDIELTEEISPSDYSLEIYIAPKGSTLWDISKHLLVTEDVLLKQNPNLVFPLESSQSIVHFVQK